MDFISIFRYIIEAFKRESIDFALIGGLALQASGVTRTTRDIDLLILSKDNKKIKDLLLSHGYDLIHESEDVLNFVGKKLELGRIDFLLAHRKYTLAILARAYEQPVLENKFKVKIIKAEDLIGLKVQSSSNDPTRLNQDMADIRSLIEVNYNKLDFGIIREYFVLFDREKELDAILGETKKDVK